MSADSLFARYPYPTWVYDEATQAILDVNAAALAAYGYTREEFVALRPHALRPLADEPRHRRRDGTLVDVEVIERPLVWQGRAARLVVAVDVTERKRTEAALRRHVAEARTMVELGRAVSASLDPHSVLQLIVDRACLLLGTQRSALAVDAPEESGSVIRFVAHHGLSPAFIERMRPVHWRDGTTATAIRERRPVWTADILNDPHLPLTAATRAAVISEGYRAVLSVPLLAGEQVLGALVTYRDTPGPFADDEVALLQAFAAQAAVALDNARLFEEAQRRRREAESLAETGRLVSQSLDPEEVSRRIAEAVCGLVDARLAVVYRRAPDGTLHMVAGAGTGVEHSEVLEPGTATVGRAIALRRPFVTPDVLHDPDVVLPPGTRDRIVRSAFAAVLAVPLIVQGTIIGALAVGDRVGRTFTPDEIQLVQSFADQTAVALENARLYAEVQSQLRRLEETQAQLLQAGKLAAVGQLIGGVAHELNNPLAVVVGHAQLLELKSRDPAILERAARILEAAHRASAIVRELQTFARPRTPELTALRLSDIVDRVLALREQTLRVSGIEVERAVGGDLPPVLGDPAQLEQVLLNLVLNAEHATRALGDGAPADRRRIRITLGREGDRLRLAIGDRGPGIPQDVLPRIFEPFYTTKPVGQGTGLGLSICYSIVAAHHGRIWAESEPGRGATFIVELPAYHGAMETRPPAAPPPRPQPRPGRVLVIDDEADVAATLRELLESLDQEVTVATGGEAGWRLLREQATAWDLVTLDLKMPDLSGQRVWERVVSGAADLARRVIFVTGDTVDPETQEFLAATGRPVVQKPFDQATLAAVLHRHLGAG